MPIAALGFLGWQAADDRRFGLVEIGHSEYELRFLLVGHSLAGRILLVVHAEKDDTIRIISARRATPREREDYEADA